MLGVVGFPTGVVDKVMDVAISGRAVAIVAGIVATPSTTGVDMGTFGVGVATGVPGADEEGVVVPKDAGATTSSDSSIFKISFLYFCITSLLCFRRSFNSAIS